MTFLEDASGYQTFFYGKMGEVIENNRTFVLPNENQPYSFKMKYSYDSWNRVQTITYPDGEVASYEYGMGGMLKRMVGQKGTQTFCYIDKIYYNHFELRDAVWYGNGTHAKYDYDTLLRLSLMESWDVLGPMQHVTYSYDRAGNIAGIQNTAPISSNGLGGNYAMTYAYDSLYRLQGSTGGLNGRKNYSYWLDMAYDANGRILRKSQLARTFTGTSSDTLMNYANLYSYGTTPVNSRVQSVADTVGVGSTQTFTWDDNGNMLTQSANTQVRTHCWDELNRLQGFSDSKHDACFLYDGSGERFYKFSGAPQAMMVNGQWSTYHALTDPTLYASPYLVATPKGYTKHYYSESERVASKVGGGGLQDLHTVCSATISFSAKCDSCAKHVTRVAGCLGVEIGSVKMNALVVLDNLYGTDNEPLPENEIYWYHPDHLGSASWVSDKAGKGIQHLYYLPWGEELDNQRATGYESRYTFSGKERDEETGYSYFGARHYHPTLSIWLSVDPMSDKYLGVSPYTYCANNPVRLVDKEGREVVNPYTAKVAETQNIISKIEQMIKEGNCDVGLAKAALRHQKEELRKFEWLEGKANFAIAALQENGQYDILNNLKDEHGNPVDVYITYNFNMSSEREAQCNISARVVYERNQNGNITNVHFLGFNSNRVYIELSGRNDGPNVCHEGGHLEYEIYECKYSEYLLWQIQNNFHYDGYNGHGEGDKSGEKANQRENQYKARHHY